MMEKETITIYDIAAEAGVSSATVSRVINGRGYVGIDTKKKVDAVIEKYNFKPNAIAKGLISKHTQTIGMLVPDIRNAYYSTVFIGIEEEAQKYGYNVMLCNSLNDLEKDYAYMDMLEQKQVEVIIQLGGQLDQTKPDKQYMKKLKSIIGQIPFFCTGYVFSEKQLHIDIDDTDAMYEAVEGLYKSGVRNYAFVGGNSSVIPSYLKHELFTRILKEYGIPPRNRQIVTSLGFDIEAGRSGVKTLIEKDNIPQAIFGVNELTAIGVMNELKELELYRDIDIIGYDNTYLSEIATPSLTCIGVDYKEFAEKTMKLIQSVLHKDTAECERIQSKLYKRRSTSF